MTGTELEIGRVVLAKAGRDKGKAFIVVGELSEEYVLIVNGAGRSIEKPKKKKIKHLEPKPVVIHELKEKLEAGKQVFDAEIRKSLKALGYES